MLRSGRYWDRLDSQRSARWAPRSKWETQGGPRYESWERTYRSHLSFSFPYASQVDIPCLICLLRLHHYTIVLERAQTTKLCMIAADLATPSQVVLCKVLIFGLEKVLLFSKYIICLENLQFIKASTICVNKNDYPGIKLAIECSMTCSELKI